MEVIVGFFCLLCGIGISIATAVLASRKGRNSVNWFFLSVFWGIIGLIVLACSRRLDKELEESDTLAKVLWLIVLIPLVSFSIFYYNKWVEKDERRRRFDAERGVRRTEIRMEYNEKSQPKTETSVEYIEKEVSLNDYIGSPNDNTDWEHTGFEDEEDAKAFNEALRKKGIYWSDAKGCYVIKVKRTTTKNVPKVQFK